MLLSHDDILKAEDIKPETVAVPEWGGEVLVQGLTGKERDAYQATLSKRIKNPDGSITAVPNTDNSDARFAAMVMVDADGKRLFRDEEAINLGDKSAAALQRVVLVGARLSGIGEMAAADAEGNSGTAPSDGSTSSEPTPPESQ